MRLEITEKFPCGYSYTIKVKSLSISNYDGVIKGICPIHGKECVLMEKKE